MIAVSSPQDIFYITGAVALVWITAFLCWALFQIGRLFKQANEMATETREKIGRLERMAMTIAEKVGNVSQYLGFIAEGGKQLLQFLHMREEKQERKVARKPKEKPEELSDLPG